MPLRPTPRRAKRHRRRRFLNPLKTDPEQYRRQAISAARARPFRWLVRVGFLARGLTYGLIGAIAIAVALGAGRQAGTPDQEGALTLVARAPLGEVALIAVAAGVAAYALWKVGLSIVGSGPEGGGGTQFTDRMGNLIGGLAYAGLFVVTLRILLGRSASQSQQERHTTAGVLAWSGGRLLVAIAGGCLIAAAVYQTYTAARGDFAQDNKLSEMSPRERGLFLRIGRIGLSARALVLGLIGYFLIRTAIDFKPSSGIGVDGALSELHRQPLGSWLLSVVAAGLLTFAVFSFFEARYQRL